MKISNEQSREIYELACDPGKKTTNAAIGAKFGISESSVRHHVRKWEKEVKAISKTNSKVAGALAAHTINIIEEASSILEAVKQGIKQAKAEGVSPEKISSLYNNWIKTLEMLSEMEIVRRIEKLEQDNHDKSINQKKT